MNDDNLPLAVKYLEELKPTNYESEEVYSKLAQSYQFMKDSVNYAKTLKEGFTKFPGNRYFMESMINVYINSGEIDKALENLDEAIKENPNVPDYWRVKGDLYENEVKDLDKALESFQKALEVDPNYSLAVAGIGRLYYNQGFVLQQKANELSYKQAQELQVEINDYYQKALPYLEKAHQMSPEDRQYIMALYAVYYALKMPEAADMEKLLNND